MDAAGLRGNDPSTLSKRDEVITLIRQESHIASGRRENTRLIHLPGHAMTDFLHYLIVVPHSGMFTFMNQILPAWRAVVLACMIASETLPRGLLLCEITSKEAPMLCFAT